MSIKVDAEFQAKSFRITTRVIWTSCIVGLVLIGIAVTGSFLIPLASNAVITTKVVLGKLALVNVCLLFGMFQSLLGVLLILLGVTAPYTIKSEGESIKLGLVSASPGILLVVISACLIWLSIGAKFNVTTETFEVFDPSAPVSNKDHSDEKLGNTKPSLNPAPLGVKGPD